jgi:MFS family permease
MRAIRAVFLANGMSMGVFFPFAAVILSTRGFSPAEIGLIQALSSAAFTIAVPAWGHLADVVLGRRNALVISALTGAAAVLAAGSPIPALGVAACFVAFSLFESGWGPPGDALAVNAVADRARDYARVRLLSSGGFAASSALVGLLYDRTGYGPAFALCAAFAIGLAVVARLTPERTWPPTDPGAAAGGRWPSRCGCSPECGAFSWRSSSSTSGSSPASRSCRSGWSPSVGALPMSR